MTTVSLSADSKYRDALAILARKRGKSIGKLVRAALDAEYGAELKEISSFFDDGDAYKHHLMHENISPSTQEPR